MILGKENMGKERSSLSRFKVLLHIYTNSKRPQATHGR